MLLYIFFNKYPDFSFLVYCFLFKYFLLEMRNLFPIAASKIIPSKKQQVAHCHGREPMENKMQKRETTLCTTCNARLQQFIDTYFVKTILESRKSSEISSKFITLQSKRKCITVDFSFPQRPPLHSFFRSLVTLKSTEFALRLLEVKRNQQI